MKIDLNLIADELIERNIPAKNVQLLHVLNIANVVTFVLQKEYNIKERLVQILKEREKDE